MAPPISLSFLFQTYLCKNEKVFKVMFRVVFTITFEALELTITTQKMKFAIKDFFSNYDQIRSFLRIWSHLLKKSLMENFIFCAVNIQYNTQIVAFKEVLPEMFSLNFKLMHNGDI